MPDRLLILAGMIVLIGGFVSSTAPLYGQSVGLEYGVTRAGYENALEHPQGVAVTSIFRWGTTLPSGSRFATTRNSWSSIALRVWDFRPRMQIAPRTSSTDGAI